MIFMMFYFDILNIKVMYMCYCLVLVFFFRILSEINWIMYIDKFWKKLLIENILLKLKILILVERGGGLYKGRFIYYLFSG